MNKKQREKGKHHEQTQTAENVAHATKHTEPSHNSWLNSKTTEQSSQKNSRRNLLMAEKEHRGRGGTGGNSRIAENCFNPPGAKKAAPCYIDPAEKLATQALDFQVKATEWAKETPIYPLIEAQQTIRRKLVEPRVRNA